MACGGFQSAWQGVDFVLFWGILREFLKILKKGRYLLAG